MTANPETHRALGDHDLQIANLARIGVIKEVQNQTARVAVGDILTDFLPWLTRRAHLDYEFWQPAIGEQVVILSLWGDLSQGVIIGAVAQNAYAAPAQGKQWGKRFSDGTTMTYDPESHALSVSAGQSPVTVICQKATIKAECITLDTPDVTCTGNLTAAGDVTADGISLKNHTHNGVQPGGGSTGKPQ